jgi:hypothetical protein
MLTKGAVRRICSAVEKVVDHAHQNRVEIVLLAGTGPGHFYELFRIIWARKYENAVPGWVSLGMVPKPKFRHIRDGYAPSKKALIAYSENIMARVLPEKGKLRGKVLVLEDASVRGFTIRAYDRALEELRIPHICATVFSGSMPNVSDRKRRANLKGYFVAEDLGDYTVPKNKKINDFILSKYTLKKARKDFRNKITLTMEFIRRKSLERRRMVAQLKRRARK